MSGATVGLFLVVGGLAIFATVTMVLFQIKAHRWERLYLTERDKPRFVTIDGTDTTPPSTTSYFMELWTLRDEAATLRITVTRLELELAEAKLARNIDRDKAELFDNLAAAIKGANLATIITEAP